MFNVGDEVRIRDKWIAGTIVYAEASYFSVELTSGAEMDFENPDLLMSEADYQEMLATIAAERKAEASTKPLAEISYVPQKGDRLLAASVIESIREIYPGLLDAMQNKDESFDKLDAFDKVALLSKLSGTPMVVFMGAGSMGKAMMRDVIRKTLLNSLISGSDLHVDILIGSARRAIKEYEAAK